MTEELSPIYGAKTGKSCRGLGLRAPRGNQTHGQLGKGHPPQSKRTVTGRTYAGAGLTLAIARYVWPKYEQEASAGLREKGFPVDQ